ncbi:MAG: PEP-CTERM sorting domain-containing protein [Verrucomicrobiota bacterium]
MTKKLSLLALGALLAAPLGAGATPLVFPATFTGPEPNASNPAALNSVWLFSNVGTDEGTDIDLRLELLATDNGAVNRISTTATNFEGKLRIGLGQSVVNNNGASATFKVSLLEAGTSKLAAVTDVSFLITDVEQFTVGSASGNEFYQVQSVTGADGTTTTVRNNPTNLNQTLTTIPTPSGNDSGVEAFATTGSEGDADPESFFGYNYSAISEFVFVWGFTGSTGGIGNNRGLNMDGDFNDLQDLIDEFPSDPDITVVPEPSSTALLLAGVAGWAYLQRQRTRRKPRG